MKKKLTVIIIAICLGVLMMAGCSGGSSAKSDSYYSSSNGYAPAAQEESYSAYSPAYGGDMDMEYAAEEAKAEASVTAENGDLISGNSALANAKLIYTAHINMETLDFDAANADLKDKLGKAGGYIENSTLSSYGSYRYASYALRIPADQYRYFCDITSEIGHVLSINENVENVSEAYFDSEARLSSAKAKLESLQELLKKAENMEDIITIQNAINDVEYDIDYYSGNLRRYDSLVSFSTIYLEINEVGRLSGTEEPAIGFGQQLSQAFKRGSENFVSGIQDFALGFARHYVGWLIFIIIVIAIIIFIKLLVKRDKKKQQKLMQQQMMMNNRPPVGSYPVNYTPQAPVQEEKANAPVSNQEPSGH
jgi:hypothetical protein